MKKIMLIVITGLVFLTQNIFGAEAKPLMPFKIWFRVDIIFHRPKLNCERGFGLCFLGSSGFENPVGTINKETCSGKIMLDEGNRLVLEVAESELARYEGGTALPNFKEKTSITLHDPYTLPPNLCKQLGAPGPLVIKPGTYPVTNSERVYRVVFQL